MGCNMGRVWETFIGRVLGTLHWTCVGPGDQTGRPYILA